MAKKVQFMVSCDNDSSTEAVSKLEKRINNFIKDKNVVDIKYGGLVVSGNVAASAMIIYEEE